ARGSRTNSLRDNGLVARMPAVPLRPPGPPRGVTGTAARRTSLSAPVVYLDTPAEAPTQDRWESALWSSLLAGLGQIRNGQASLGFVMLRSQAISLTLVIASALSQRITIPVGVGAAVVIFAIQILSIVQAFRRARAQGDDTQPPSAFKSALL